MNRNYQSWLYDNLDDCCKRYYSWDVVGCKQANAESTLVTGFISSEADPTSGLFYPDWGRTDVCQSNIDGSAPAYMKKQHTLWMYETLEKCCKAYYNWEGGLEECMISQGGDPPTRSPITESWYINWEEYKCVESCEGSGPCGGHQDEWDKLHASKAACCREHLDWVKLDDCLKDETSTQ